MFNSPIHRYTFFFTVASCVVWFFVLRSWSGTIIAAIFCVPVGFIFSFLPPMIVGTLRQTPLFGDVVLTWGPILGGTALLVYGFVGVGGATQWLLALTGAGFVITGSTLLSMRFVADRIREGTSTESDAQYVDDIYNIPR